MFLVSSSLAQPADFIFLAVFPYYRLPLSAEEAVEAPVGGRTRVSEVTQGGCLSLPVPSPSLPALYFCFFNICILFTYLPSQQQLPKSLASASSWPLSSFLPPSPSPRPEPQTSPTVFFLVFLSVCAFGLLRKSFMWSRLLASSWDPPASTLRCWGNRRALPTPLLLHPLYLAEPPNIPGRSRSSPP